MIFGPTLLDDAVGAILAHGTKHADGMFKKGRVLSAEDVAALRKAGLVSVIAARLQVDDVPEDEAARAVSLALCGSGARPQAPFTGRANLYAMGKGVAVFDEARLKAINHLHESLTIATLPNFSRVEARQMVATVKVIPFAVPRTVLEKALAIMAGVPLLRVASFQPMRAGLVITRLPQSKDQIVCKSEESMRERLLSMGASLGSVVVSSHAEDDVAIALRKLHGEGCSPLLVFGASAIVDRADVIPGAVVRAGGKVGHLGMPVDPGNLLMLGELDGVPVVGVPSCARSPKVNGFDWVLERLVAGVPVTASDVMDMGSGGLLAEIPSRPSPREGKGTALLAPKVTAVVLAAGTSSRMGSNKLLAEFKGGPLLAATLAAITKSVVDDVVVVTGRDADAVAAVALDAGARPVHNPHYSSGIATSIRAGIAAATDADAVLVCLGDMPLMEPSTFDRLVSAFNPTEHRTIIAPVHGGQFGNPVLWGREHFPRLMALEGDKGARSLIGALKSEAVEVLVDDPGVLMDADTPEALQSLRMRTQRSDQLQ